MPRADPYPRKDPADHPGVNTRAGQAGAVLVVTALAAAFSWAIGSAAGLRHDALLALVLGVATLALAFATWFVSTLQPSAADQLRAAVQAVLAGTEQVDSHEEGDRPTVPGQRQKAEKMLEWAELVKDAMENYSQGYRDVCGKLLAFDKNWPKGDRIEAAHEFERWVWDRSYSRLLENNLSLLRIVDPAPEALHDLLSAAEWFRWNVVEQLLDEKAPQKLMKVQRALRDPGGVDGADPLIEWVGAALSIIDSGDDAVRAVQADLARLKAQADPADTMTAVPPDEIGHWTWRLVGAPSGSQTS